MKTARLTAAIALAFAASAQAIVVTNTSSAEALAKVIVGSGVTISNVTLTGNSATSQGTFTGGQSSVGFEDGIVLTTGTTACVPGPNSQNSCDEGGTVKATTLQFDFRSGSGILQFNYVFASEEYNEYVGSYFNDVFYLMLDNTNIALLPSGAGVVSINNVNCASNSAYYRNNSTDTSTQYLTNEPSVANCPNQQLDMQYDGLTTVLTATALLSAGDHHFNFYIADVGDRNLDSGVFIKAGSFSAVAPPSPSSIPEPGSLALVAVALTTGSVLRRLNKTN